MQHFLLPQFFLASIPAPQLRCFVLVVPFIMLLVKQAQLSFSLHPGRARGPGDGEEGTG